jgi:hypothetical protein
MTKSQTPSAPLQKLFTCAASLALTFLLTACGAGDSVVSNVMGSQTVTLPNPGPFMPGTGYLEVDQSAINVMQQANSATLSLTQDGGTTVLRISTPATPTQTTGTFVGGGIGNKSIVQLDGFDGLRVADLGTVELDATMVTGGTANFYMNFIVDLDCVKNEDLTTMTIADIRANRRIMVWNPVAGIVQPDGYTRFSTSASAADWKIVGNPSLGFGLNPSGIAAPLTPTFSLAGYPNACIVDGVSADGGLPRNLSIPACVTNAALPATASAACGIAHKGALILLGDSRTLDAKTYYVKRVKIKDREIVFR